MAELPGGTVTLLFTDVEGSTRLVQQLGDDYGAVLTELRRLIRTAVAEAGGHEVDCRADEHFAAFQRARDGVAAAAAAQSMVASQTWPEGASVRVRMGLHTGEPALEAGAYLGLDVSRASRVCAAGHGGQTLVSQTTRDLVGTTSQFSDLGVHSLAGLPQPERIFQLVVPGLRADFPPLRVDAANRRRLRARFPRRRSHEPTLEETAWQARRLLPHLASPLQGALAEVGGALFTGHRAVEGVDRLVARVDRAQLTRRLGAQRELAVFSQRARQQVAALEAQIACLERVLERRDALTGLGAEVATMLDQTLSPETITGWQRRIAAATAELDAAADGAARILDLSSFKLERTRYRGIYRFGTSYVVPFTDELGGERRRDFETLDEAQAFRDAIRVAARGKQTAADSAMPPGGGGGSW